MVLSESVPVWIMAGSVAVGGWFYEQVSSRTDYVDVSLASKSERIIKLETANESLTSDIREIKHGIERIEDRLMEKPNE